MKAKHILLNVTLVLCLFVCDCAFAGSLNLLNRLSYVPEERSQGSCGNCWVWASTGVMEIARNVQSGGSERLSVQFLNSCKTDQYACFGGRADMFRNWYQDVAGFAIPWSNTNASFQDASQYYGQQQSNVSCGSIVKSPNYPVGSTIGLTQLTTAGVGQATAIASIKNVLNNNRAVWTGFFLPNDNWWHGTNGFTTWFNNNGQSAIWNPDAACGSTWDSVNGAGGHAVIIVGYNDDDPNPANHYWIVLNSWGTANGLRPDGIYHLAMNVNYDCTYNNGGQLVPGLIFFDFNYVFPENTTCTYSISPTNQSFGSVSGSGGVSVTTQSGCQWTVSGYPDWITIIGSSSGTGSGYVSYSIAANTGTQSRQATFTIAGKSFAVSQEGASTIPSSILLNGDFESGIQGWSEYSSGNYELIMNYYLWAHMGSWFAWLGGYDQAYEYVYQDVTIPADATSASVNFFYQIFTDEVYPAIYDTMAIAIVNPATGTILRTLDTLSNLNASNDWVKSNSYDISQYIGQPIRLAFIANNDASLPTSFLVDDADLAVTYPAKSNLTPYQPNGWSDKIVVSNAVGVYTDSTPLYTTDSLYVNWAVTNSGSMAAPTGFLVALYLDSVLKQTWSANAIPVNYYSYVTDYSLGHLSAGTHTIRIVADSAHAISESDESDNEYTKTVTVQAAPVLSVSLSGEGAVNSSPSGIACTTGNSGVCSHTFVVGSTVTLMPTAGSGSMFSNWGNGCTDLNDDDCLVTMPEATNISITANFIASALARIPGVGGYISLQSAYDSAAMSCTIQAQATVLPALDFTLDKGKNISFEGGFDSSYTISSGGFTTMRGILTVKTGSITIENLIIE